MNVIDENENKNNCIICLEGDIQNEIVKLFKCYGTNNYCNGCYLHDKCFIQYVSGYNNLCLNCNTNNISNFPENNNQQEIESPRQNQNIIVVINNDNIRINRELNNAGSIRHNGIRCIIIIICILVVISFFFHIINSL